MYEKYKAFSLTFLTENVTINSLDLRFPLVVSRRGRPKGADMTVIGIKKKKKRRRFY
jgi:hypothetical protein